MIGISRAGIFGKWMTVCIAFIIYVLVKDEC